MCSCVPQFWQQPVCSSEQVRDVSPPGCFTLCSSQRLQVSPCGRTARCPVMDVTAAATWASVGPPHVVILSTKLGPSGTNVFDVKCLKPSVKCLIWRHVCAANGSPPTPHWDLWTCCSTGKLLFTSSFVFCQVSCPTC